MQTKKMQTKLKKNVRLVGTALLLAGALVSAGAQAEATFNAGLKSTGESNINGATVKANELSDRYTTLNASGVYYTALDSEKTSYFIGQVGASSNKYSTYTGLDNSSVGASVGLYQQLTRSWSAQLTGRGFSRSTEQTARDSKGWGSTLEIKNQLSATVWIKGVADYESSKANLNSNDNTGNTLGLSMGFLPLENTFASLGFNQNKRDFTLSSFKTTSNTYYVDLTQRLTKNWYLNGAYAMQDNSNNASDLSSKNNILSAAINLSF